MDKLFQNNTDGEGEHPPRETLLLWVDGELSSREATQIQTHLEACWHCRVKTKKIEEAIADIIEFDEEILKTRLLPPNNWRGFDLRLSQLAAEGDTRSLISKVLGPLGRLFSTVNLFFMPRPLVRVVVALLVLAIIVVFAVRFDREPVVSASELLRNATEAQATRVNKTTQPVIHQQLRVRRVGGSSPADSVDWEIWNDTTSPRFRQSVSENGHRRFISTSTTTPKSDGTNSTPPVLSDLETALRTNHMDPQRPLSPISFKAWRDSLDQKHDEITKSRLASGVEALTLRTVRIGETNIGHIAEASLLVRARDWHPEALRLIVRGEGGNHEYELIETAFQVVSLPTLSPEIFSEQPQQIASTQLPSARPSPSPMLNVNPLPLAVTPTRAVATAELEIEVLRLLNQAGADLGEQVSATRNPDGLLRVEGIVETDVRKSEILRALEPISSNPAVRIEIKSVAEALAEKREEDSKPSQPAKQQKIEIQSGSATEFELRSYFGSDEQARQFAARMVSRSQRAMRHLYALKRLANQFSPEELRSLAPEAKAKWFSLVRSHARTYQQEVGALRQELRLVFFSSAPPDASAAESEITDTSGMVQAVNQLFNLGSANDRVILSAFTSSAEAVTVTALKTTQFWQSLQAAEGLASRIQSANWQ
jgi:hypothetical protein